MRSIPGEAIVNFKRGGVALNRVSTKVWLTFFSNRNRVIVEIPVPYYLLEGHNKKEVLGMIETGWDNAAQFSTKKAFSDPSAKMVLSIYNTIKELLEM